jgi:hypothetical protein
MAAGLERASYRKTKNTTKAFGKKNLEALYFSRRDHKLYCKQHKLNRICWSIHWGQVLNSEYHLNADVSIAAKGLAHSRP